MDTLLTVDELAEPLRVFVLESDLDVDVAQVPTVRSAGAAALPLMGAAAHDLAAARTAADL